MEFRLVLFRSPGGRGVRHVVRDRRLRRHVRAQARCRGVDQLVHLSSPVPRFVDQRMLKIVPEIWLDVSSALAFAWKLRCAAIRLTSSSVMRSAEHTSELKSLMRISYAVFCLKKKHQK